MLALRDLEKALISIRRLPDDLLSLREDGKGAALEVSAHNRFDCFATGLLSALGLSNKYLLR